MMRLRALARSPERGAGPLGEFHVDLRVNFDEALKHYRHVVGVQDHA